MGLVKFYIVYDLRYFQKCHNRSTQSLDPAYRQFLRNQLQSNSIIKREYMVKAQVKVNDSQADEFITNTLRKKDSHHEIKRI